eukprot:5325417-Pleurochrysis_carterae.AAC.1
MASHVPAQQTETPAHHPQGTELGRGDAVAASQPGTSIHSGTASAVGGYPRGLPQSPSAHPTLSERVVRRKEPVAQPRLGTEVLITRQCLHEGVRSEPDG